MERHFDDLIKDYVQGEFKTASIEVMDTCYVVKAWFDQDGVDYDGTAIMADVKLILERERTNSELVPR